MKFLSAIGKIVLAVGMEDADTFKGQMVLCAAIFGIALLLAFLFTGSTNPASAAIAAKFVKIFASLAFVAGLVSMLLPSCQGFHRIAKTLGKEDE